MSTYAGYTLMGSEPASWPRARPCSVCRPVGRRLDQAWHLAIDVQATKPATRMFTDVPDTNRHRRPEANSLAPPQSEGSPPRPSGITRRPFWFSDRPPTHRTTHETKGDGDVRRREHRGARARQSRHRPAVRRRRVVGRRPLQRRRRHPDRAVLQRGAPGHRQGQAHLRRCARRWSSASRGPSSVASPGASGAASSSSTAGSWRPSGVGAVRPRTLGPRTSCRRSRSRSTWSAGSSSAPPDRCGLPPDVLSVQGGMRAGRGNERSGGAPPAHRPREPRPARRAADHPAATVGSPRSGSTVARMRRSRALAVATLLLLGALSSCDDGAADEPSADRRRRPDRRRRSASTVLAGLGDGDDVDLADLRGRPVVVNFFASTCAPCVREMPALEAVHQAAGDDVAFVGVAVNDRVDDALELVEQTGVTYHLAADPTGELFTAAGATLLPTTIVLDADGEVVRRLTGELDADELVDALADATGVEVTPVIEGQFADRLRRRSAGRRQPVRVRHAARLPRRSSSASRVRARTPGPGCRGRSPSGSRCRRGSPPRSSWSTRSSDTSPATSSSGARGSPSASGSPSVPSASTCWPATSLKVHLPRLDRGGRTGSLGSMVLYGVSYAVVSLGCTLPTFSAYVTATNRTESWLSGSGDVPRLRPRLHVAAHRAHHRHRPGPPGPAALRPRVRSPTSSASPAGCWCSPAPTSPTTAGTSCTGPRRGGRRRSTGSPAGPTTSPCGSATSGPVALGLVLALVVAAAAVAVATRRRSAA